MTAQFQMNGNEVMRTFKSTSAALKWDDGLVLGTGSVGALVWGTGHPVTVALAHEEFFLPVNSHILPPSLDSDFDRIRQAVRDRKPVLAGEILDAATEREGYDNWVWTDPFVPAATIEIALTKGGEESQRREVDLGTNTSTVTWSSGAQVVTRADRARNRIIVQILRTDGEPIRVTLGVTETTAEEKSFIKASYRDCIEVEAGIERSGLTCITRAKVPTSLRIARTRVQFEAVPNATGRREGSVWAEFHESFIEMLVEVEVEAELPPVADALETARTDHEVLFNRSALSLNGAAFSSSEELLARARSGEVGAVRAAIEFAFATGRSNAIAATGQVPPNLVGVWQGTWSPEWSGDYTLNGNVQNGAVAGLISTGTPELMLSLFRLIERFRSHYRVNSRRLFGSSGAFVPARISTHGLANHFAVVAPHNFWLGGSAWIARMSFNYFGATGDLRFVRDWALPFAADAIALIERLGYDEGGVRHVAPSYSPENTPAGYPNPITADATSDIAMLRDLLLVGARFAELLGEFETASRWRAQRDEFAPYRIAPDGQLAEWLAHEDQPMHRHSSHLYPLWYEGEERFDNVAIRAAAARSIAERMAYRAKDPTAPPGHMEMAFGLQQLGVAAARLGDAATARQCAEWLAVCHWTPAGTSTHDAGVIFNMDSSGALPSLVAEMLVHAEPERLTLFPALPDAWPVGAIEGLRGHGGIVVERLDWEDGSASAKLRRAPGSQAAWPERTRLESGPGWRIEGESTIVIGLEPVRITLRSDRGT